ncbi:hypothetical protein ACOMHN_002920 [Nucella lapillus]
MPNKCCIYKCNNVRGHAFPSDPIVRREWIEAVNREESFTPSKNSIVCKKHFREEDYLDGPTYVGSVVRQRQILKPGAVPSLNLTSERPEKKSRRGGFRPKNRQKEQQDPPPASRPQKKQKCRPSKAAQTQREQPSLPRGAKLQKEHQCLHRGALSQEQQGLSSDSRPQVRVFRGGPFLLVSLKLNGCGKQSSEVLREKTAEADSSEDLQDQDQVGESVPPPVIDDGSFWPTLDHTYCSLLSQKTRKRKVRARGIEGSRCQENRGENDVKGHPTSATTEAAEASLSCTPQPSAADDKIQKRPAREVCCALGCRSLRSNRSKSFFSLPADIARCSRWLHKIGRQDLLENCPYQLRVKGYKVCSDHFRIKDFVNARGSLRLRGHVVPVDCISSQKDEPEEPPAVSKLEVKVEMDRTEDPAVHPCPPVCPEEIYVGFKPGTSGGLQYASDVCSIVLQGSSTSEDLEPDSGYSGHSVVLQGPRTSGDLQSASGDKLSMVLQGSSTLRHLHSASGGELSMVLQGPRTPGGLQSDSDGHSMVLQGSSISGDFHSASGDELSMVLQGPRTSEDLQSACEHDGHSVALPETFDCDIDAPSDVVDYGYIKSEPVDRRPAILLNISDFLKSQPSREGEGTLPITSESCDTSSQNMVDLIKSEPAEEERNLSVSIESWYTPPNGVDCIKTETIEGEEMYVSGDIENMDTPPSTVDLIKAEPVQEGGETLSSVSNESLREFSWRNRTEADTSGVRNGEPCYRDGSAQTSREQLESWCAMDGTCSEQSVNSREQPSGHDRQTTASDVVEEDDVDMTYVVVKAEPESDEEER